MSKDNQKVEEVESTIQVAAYSLGYFPEYQDESTELGQKILAKQLIMVNHLIESAFQDVFGKPFDESLVADCERVIENPGPNEKQVLFYQGKPFLELGELREEFREIDGVQHLVVDQPFRVIDHNNEETKD